MREERGAATVERLGSVAVAAVLVLAIILAFAGFRWGDELASALCRVSSAISGGGNCDVDGPIRSAGDYVPPEQCVVSSEGGENSANISFVVTLEGGEEWLVEELGDGTYRLTHQGEGGASVGIGIGGGATVTVDGQTYGANASAGLSTGLQIAGGETFYVDSEDEAVELLSQQRQDTTKDAVLGDGGFARWAYDGVAGALGDDTEGEQAEPDEWFVEGGSVTEGSAGVEGGLPGLQADTGIEGAAELYLGRTERSDGTSTDYLQADLSGNANFGGNVPDENGSDTFLANSIGGSASAVVEVDRDADGNPVAMRLTSATGGHAVSDESHDQGNLDSTANEMTSKTMQIPLENDADIDVASRMLQTLGVPYVPGVTDPSDITDAAVTPGRFNDLSQDLADLALERGYYWEQEYTEDSSTDLAVQVDAEMGAVTGIGGSSVSNARTTSGYSYWNGQEMVERSGCAA